MDDKTRKTWISILIASVIVIGMLAIAVVGGVAYFMSHHINAQFTQKENAEGEFSAARARFSGQTPLIEVKIGHEPVVHRELLDGKDESGKVDSLHVLAYDPTAHKLVRVSIPFWLIRLAPGKHLTVLSDNGIDIDSDRVRLSATDLDRLGPGLLLDHEDARGQLVLVWTE
jgi:hypothetical protein